MSETYLGVEGEPPSEEHQGHGGHGGDVAQGEGEGLHCLRVDQVRARALDGLGGTIQ